MLAPINFACVAPNLQGATKQPSLPLARDTAPARRLADSMISRSLATSARFGAHGTATRAALRMWAPAPTHE